MTDEEREPFEAGELDDAESLGIDEPLSAYDEPAQSEPMERIPITGTRRRPRAMPPRQRDYAPPRRRGYGCADVITAVFLLLTVLVISLTVLLIQNPYSPLNPFPPLTLAPVMVIATPLPTETPSDTPTPEPPTPTIPTATPTDTPTPTETPTPTVTQTPVVGGIVTLTPGEATPPAATIPAQVGTRPPFPFSVKSIRYQPNEGPNACKWQSIAGVVLNLEGVPRRRDEPGLTVHVQSVDDNTIDEFAPTGGQPRFGESGFEAFLGETPRIATYTVELRGVTGSPVSEKIVVQTRSTCEENVAFVEFVQNYTY